MMLLAPHESAGRYQSRQPVRIRNLGRAILPRRGPSLRRVGPVVFVNSSVQTRKVLAPVKDELVPEFGPSTELQLPPLGPRSVRDGQRSAHGVLAQYREWFAREGLPEPPALAEEVLKVEFLQSRAIKARLRDQGIAAVVVATQHNGSTRALLAAANESNGPATYYMPHAPTADNLFYQDLPTHFALLRGDSEVRYYESLGVTDPSRLVTVGNPALAAPPPKAIPRAEHVVYAPSLQSEEMLRADVDVIRSAVDRPIHVSLHPRMTASTYAGFFPPEWRLLGPGSTIGHLEASGAFAMIQHGSGVGLEALLYGIDVVDLCHVDERPNYPYISPPYVQIAHDGPSLRHALALVPARETERDRRIAFAHGWCAQTGRPAAQAAADFIRSTMATDRPHRVLLDGWAVP